MGVLNTFKSIFSKPKPKVVRKQVPYSSASIKYANLDDLKRLDWHVKKNYDYETNAFPNWRYAVKRLHNGLKTVVVRIAEVAYNTFVVFIDGKGIKEVGTKGKHYVWYSSINAALAQIKMMVGWV